MKLIVYLFLALFFASISNTNAQTHSENGYQPLFDGKTLNGWRMATRDTAPGISWSAENGEISFDPTKDHGSDIITTRSFKDFDLSVDFKISEGGNSGIKYFLLPNTNLGCEF